MNYLFLDAEFTGKDYQKCRLLEVAGFFVNSSLEKKNKFSVIINPGDCYWEQEALKMHTKTGLVQECVEGCSETVAKDNFRSFVDSYKSTQDDKTIYLAGNSVWTDRIVLCNVWGKQFIDQLFETHRVIDVSSISMMFRDQFGKDAHDLIDNKFFLNHTSHRAMDDANYSYELYKAMIKTTREMLK